MKILKILKKIYIFWPCFVYAEGETFPDPLGGKTLPELIDDIMSWVIMIALPIASIMIIYAGFLFVTSKGNEEKLKKAKSVLLWAIIGTAVVIGAKGLAAAFVNFAKTV
ncbi:pilin [Patescibacteria group bacterium]